MCGSMVDIQSATAEIRQKEDEQRTGWKYIWPVLLHWAAMKYNIRLTTTVYSTPIMSDDVIFSKALLTTVYRMKATRKRPTHLVRNS